jgi:hypothetical protein
MSQTEFRLAGRSFHTPVLQAAFIEAGPYTAGKCITFLQCVSVNNVCCGK